jgi:hypothetical protein
MKILTLIQDGDKITASQNGMTLLEARQVLDSLILQSVSQDTARAYRDRVRMGFRKARQRKKGRVRLTRKDTPNTNNTQAKK